EFLQFPDAVVVVETLRRRNTLDVPCRMIAAVQPDNGQLRDCHLPHHRDGVRRPRWLVCDDVDQSALPLEVERDGSFPAFKPGFVAKLDRESTARQLPLALLD